MFIILMATYNGELYIKQQIDSILMQSYTNWLLYISDDNSSDRTMSILKQYADAFPQKIKIIINEGREHGARANFNNLILHAPKAEYYAFCDQDDVWDKDKLKVLVKAYKKVNDNIPQVIYHEIAVVNQKLEILCESFSDYSKLYLDLSKPFHALLLGNYVPGCGMSFNWELKKILKPAPENARMHDWWTILAGAAFGEIHKIDKILLYYRQHRNNTIGVNESMTQKEVLLNSFVPKQLYERIQIAKKLKKKGVLVSKTFLEEYGEFCTKEQKNYVKKNMQRMQSRHGFLSVIRMLKTGNYYSMDLVRSIVYWFVRI